MTSVPFGQQHGCRAARGCLNRHTWPDRVVDVRASEPQGTRHHAMARRDTATRVSRRVRFWDPRARPARWMDLYRLMERVSAKVGIFAPS
jgi:hypothetical protein